MPETIARPLRRARTQDAATGMARSPAAAPVPALAFRRALLQGVSLTALAVTGAVAPPAHAAPFRSLQQALQSRAAATAVTAAATGGGATAASTAQAGADNVAKAAAKFQSLNQALANVNAAAGYTGPSVADGIAPTGLQQAAGVAGSANSTLWSGASTTLTQSVSNGTTDVTVTQTSSTAYLTWKNFSVGAKTALIYNQSAGGSLASNWIAINYIPAGDNPTTILGQISAPGKVYIINPNGVLFAAGSRVNLDALVASTANIAAGQLSTGSNGLVSAYTLYGSTSGSAYLPAFTGATAPVTVEAGAAITTTTPTGSNTGGYVMLLGDNVTNAGAISTPRGQVVLAAGSDFYVEPGYSSSNTLATVLGSAIAVTNAGTGSGTMGAVTNSGILVADQGDISLVGHLVTQAGVILSTTTVDNRGTVHLLTDTNDTTGQVILAPGSITEILPEDDGETALTSQRETDLSTSAAYNKNRANAAASGVPLLSTYNILPDEIGESRIEISTGGTVTLQAGALALAQGGQVAVGGNSINVLSGATIDVSGTSAVLPASMNDLNVNPIVAYYLRDSAANRTGGLEFGNVYVDERTLQEISGTGSYAGNIYTQGGLLEVSGLLGLVEHGITEFSSVGGQVYLQTGTATNSSSTGGTVLVAPGATINLTGGTVTYDAGLVKQSYVITTSGQVFNINDAPGNLVYAGIYDGQVETQARWHITDTYVNPLLTPAEIYEPAYTIGRDAGTLVVTGGTGIIDGTIEAGVTVGQNQVSARPASVTDPFLLAQTVTPLAATLEVGGFIGGTLSSPFASSIVLGSSGNSGNGTTVVTAVPDTLTGTVSIDTAQLDADGLGSAVFYTSGAITVTGSVALANGGSLVFSGNKIDVGADLSARDGSITLTNLQPSAGNLNPDATNPGSIAVSSGVTLDASGTWTNFELDPGNATQAGYANGGTVTITGTGGVDLPQGVTVNVSSGGVLSQAGKLTTANGGSVFVSADIVPTLDTSLYLYGAVDYGADFMGWGSATGSGGGTLSLSAPQVILGAATAGFDNVAVISPTLFNAGFADYALNGYLGLTVTPGTQIAVTRPIYNASNIDAPTGTADCSAFTVQTLPVFYQTKGNDTFAQRPGASLTLAASIAPANFAGGGGPVTIGQGASITVDPKQSITIEGYGQVTDLGTLTAHGGTIGIYNTRYENTQLTQGDTANYAALSVWIGDQALVDVSGVATVFTDDAGRRFGQGMAGGTIDLGGLGGANTNTVDTTYAQVIVRPGAVLDAQGASATIDASPGLAAGGVVGYAAPVTLAGNGGSIVARSIEGVALDGTMLAGGAGAGAAGGSLTLRIDAVLLSDLINLPTDAYVAGQVIVSQDAVAVQPATGLAPGDAPVADTIGIGRISAQQLTAGGFDSLRLYAVGDIAFEGNVALSLNRSLILESDIIGDTAGNAHVTLNAPYVAFIGTSASANYDGGIFNTAQNPLSTVSPANATGTLTVNADMIDIGNTLDLGGISLQGSAPVPAGGGIEQSALAYAQGFAQANFNSAGDIRFDGDTGGTLAVLASSGNITFRAEQLYPATSAPDLIVQQQVIAGYNSFAGTMNVNQYAGGTLTVERASGPTPQVPFSVGGTLMLTADTVIQDGVVRAPEGEIQLGVQRPSGANNLHVTDNVVLGDDSITSVSLDGLSVPYGGTVDGVNYLYQGEAVSGFTPVIELAGVNVDIATGARIDVSGGGTLAGAGFITGRGGSADVNVTPLLNSDTGTVTANTTDPIYAILPGYKNDYAPLAPLDSAYSAASEGEQIVIRAGEVAGLAAGTYTLLPAYYDLLPGAYRVELTSGVAPAGTALSFGNFTTAAAVTVTTANTGIAGSLPEEALITPQAGVAQLSQYDTENYSSFAIASAATFDQPRGQLPGDAKTLVIDLSKSIIPPSSSGTASGSGSASAAAGTLSIGTGVLEDGTATGGTGATVEVISNAAIEVTAPGQAVIPLTEPNGNGVTTLTTVGIDASALSSLDAPRLVIGGSISTVAALPNELFVSSNTPEVVVEQGASLTGGDVMLVANSQGTISVSGGATITAVAPAAAAPGFAQGFYFETDGAGVAFPVLDVSGVQQVFGANTQSSGAAINVSAGATLQAAGSLNFVAPAGASVNVGEASLQGKYVDLQVADITIGSATDLAAFADTLPAGLTLSDATLNTLANNTSQLILTAQDAVNIIGSVSLDSSKTDLVLNTPAIFGYGVTTSGTAVTTVNGTSTTTSLAATDAGNASITAPNLTWGGVLTQLTNGNGITTNVSATPGGRLAGSASVSGTVTSSDGNTTTVSNQTLTLTDAAGLTLDATGVLTLGYGPNARVNDQVSLTRETLGYQTVTLQAGTEVTANAKSALSVWQDQSVAGSAGTQGDLTIATPMLTSASGAVLGLSAGGTLSVAPLAGGTGAATGTVATLGGEIDITAGTVDTGSSIALPSGKLSITAENGIDIGAGSLLDLSGRATKIFDQTAQSSGGTLILQAYAGSNASISEDAGATITVASPGDAGGDVTAIAAGGSVAFNGALEGSGPVSGGSFTVYAATLSTANTSTTGFDTLNALLNAGGFTQARTIELATGDIAIDQSITAHSVTISADAGSIDVSGTIDAAGSGPGTIVLSAQNTLTLEASAVLDAHASSTAKDSYGNDIDSENRAEVTLTSAGGTVALSSGATIDVSYPDAASNPQGLVEIYAPRSTGSLAAVNVVASGALSITGEKSIDLFGETTYTPGVADGVVVQDNGQGSAAGSAVTSSGTIGLVQINADSQAWIAGIDANPAPFEAQAAGLVAYGAKFNLLPGVTIASAPGGSLTITGDLDFSGFRYSDPAAFGIAATSVYGSGEPGAIAFRSANDLTVNGSVSDGFELPVDAQTGTLIGAETSGWEFLTQTGSTGFETTNQDVLLPQGALAVSAKSGNSSTVYLIGNVNGSATAFDTTRPIALNYAIVITAADLQSNVVIPFQITVGSTSNAIPAGGWVATSAITYTRAGVTSTIAAGQLIPAGFVFQPGDVIAAGAVLPVSVQTGNTAGYPGQLVPAGTPFSVFADPQIYLAQNVALQANDLLPALSDFEFGGLYSGKVTPVSEVAYRASSEQFGGTTAVQGYLFPLAAMLPAGDLSWNMSFTAGANLAAASSSSVQPETTLYGGVFASKPAIIAAEPGSLLIDDEHELDNAASGSINGAYVVPAFSVIRTGTGDLSLDAGGGVDVSSLYGIYTAGTQSPLGNGEDAQFNSGRQAENGSLLLPGIGKISGATVSALTEDVYQADYPNDGGDFTLVAQGDVTSDTLASGNSGTSIPPSDLVGNWLWRQGSTQLGQSTAWWINFGTLLTPLGDTGSPTTPPGTPGVAVILDGFTGFGALGGGNVTVRIGGDAGQITDRDAGGGAHSSGGGASFDSGEGLVIAVGGTGRLVGGTVVTTGGGLLNVSIGGTLNPLDAQAYGTGAAAGGSGAQSTEDPSVNGDLIDLRGNINVTAGQIGRIDYQFDQGTANFFDPRALDPFNPDNGVPNGGIEVIPGDGTVSLATLRDLVLQGAADPGRVVLQSLTDLSPYDSVLGTDTTIGGYSGFSLWSAGTAISLFSAGGNVTPTTLPNLATLATPFNDAPTDYRSLFPPTLSVTAASGDIIYGQDGLNPDTGSGYVLASLETMPAPSGQVQFLAGGSIYANGYAVDISGANPAGLSLPADPAFSSNSGAASGGISNIRTGIGTNQSPLALFAEEADTPTTDLHQDDTQPARFYAAGGDIVNFQTGETLYFNGNASEPQPDWYIAAKPVWIIAAEDIVSSGTRPTNYPNANVFAVQENQITESITTALNQGISYDTSGNLFFNPSATSISLIEAGRDILSTYAYVGGPGALEVQAGRNLYQAGYTISGTTQELSFGSFKSLGDGLITGSPLTTTGGAGIDVLAGVGSAGPDYTAFADAYLNPDNQANLAIPITDPRNKGKVQQVYTVALVTWLSENFGYTGGQSGALAAFLALPAVDQGVFVRQVFFEELAASAAQETNPASRFYKSYVRGKQAIDMLFPSTGTETEAGTPAGYTGQITMYSGTVLAPGSSNAIAASGGTAATFDGGIASLYGGPIQVLDPGGQTVFGITGGPAPGNSSGIVAYGTGDVDVYALGNVALGQSRIFTTGGGNIEIWSSVGDINAGIGAKTTVVYNPPSLLYDDQGDITETPPATTSGAGIATLQPLPDVQAGDVTLVAPFGTIDPGEAGVRVSGNLTLAAARVVTTNIAVGGKTAGAPTVSSVSLGAAEAAGAAAGATTNAAENASQRSSGGEDNAASVLEVEVVSIGGTYDEEQKKRKRGL